MSKARVAGRAGHIQYVDFCGQPVQSVLSCLLESYNVRRAISTSTGASSATQLAASNCGFFRKPRRAVVMSLMTVATTCIGEVGYVVGKSAG